MTIFESYIIVMLNNISALFAVSTVILFIITSAFFIISFIEETVKKFVRPFFVMLTISSLGFTLTPTTKQMATIIVLPSIVNNKQIQHTVVNGLDLMELTTEWLKDQIKKGNKNEQTFK